MTKVVLTNTSRPNESLEQSLARNKERPALLNERGTTHGDFVENGIVMQELKSVCRKHWKWEQLAAFKREAIEMIQHKVGRILCGDDDFDDHWIDIAGYANLVAERCQHKVKK